MTNGYNTPIGVPIGLPSILSLGLPPLVNPYPTLNLDFINNPQFDSRITFSRGSQATLFDSTGTLVYAKQNLLLQSQALTTSPWITTSLSAVGSKIAPDGTATAIAITATGTNGRTRQPVTVVAGQTYTHSMFVRRVTGSGNVTLAILDSGGTALFSTVLSLTSEWQRFTVSGAPAVTSILAGIIIATSTDAIEVWGAQLNLANMEGGVTSSLTTYYPTTTAAYYAPRFDYNPSTLQPRGLLIEEQRTNSIRNNTGVGAVVGSPGTDPTNWAVSPSAAGLTKEIVAIGTENGIAYVDIRYSGTPSSGSNVSISFEGTNNVVASSGQTWTESVYVKLQAGAFTNTSTTLSLIGTNGTSGTEGFSSAAITSTPSDLRNCRLSVTGTLANAGTTHIQPRVRIGYTIGAAFDITLRIGLPQLELGAFATSVIPTTTTALTRNADVATMTGTNFSSWYNQTEGTLFAQASSASATANIVGSSDNTNSNRVVLGTNTGPNSRLLMTTLGSLQASVSVAYTLNTVAKFAGAYKLNSSNFASNGTLGIEDTVCTIPTVDRLSIGTNTTATDFFLNGWISRIAYYPTRLPNTTLQALTA